jgi:transposase, IS605 orfB family
VDRNFKSFFALLKKKHAGKYDKPINIPKYKDKDGYNCITINAVKLGKQFKQDGTLTIPNTAPNKIQFKVKNYSTCTQVRFIPCNGYIKMEAIYNYSKPMMKEDNGNYLSIDLGINNLCTCTSNVINSFLIDGKKLK